MKEIYTVGGLCIGMLGILGTLIGAWINIRTKLATMEIKILEVEKDLKRTDDEIKDHKHDVKAYMEKVDDKLGHIYKGISDIKVSLAQKADKKG